MVINVTKCLSLSRYNFSVKASSIRTSGCVILYEDNCCHHYSTTYTYDNPNLRPSLKVARSIGPCSQVQEPSPESISETWSGHSQTMTVASEVDNVTIYYNSDMTKSALEYHRVVFSKVWDYVSRYYRRMVQDGSNLTVFMHANVHGPTYSTNSFQTYFDEESGCRNMIDLVGDSKAWSKPLAGVEFDKILHEISHIVENTSNWVHGSPSQGFWGDSTSSKWAEIFAYDVYTNLGYSQESYRVYEMWMNKTANFPKPNTYWFRDWFFPLWRDYGGSLIFRQYFWLLSRHYPKEPDQFWNYKGDAVINMGEFVHFFSGAAGKNLVDVARIAFKMNSQDEKQLEQARMAYPGIQYPG